MTSELNQAVTKAKKSVNKPSKSTKSSKSSSKLTHEQFTVKAIEQLRTNKSKGIHIVYSGFLSAFRQYFELDKSQSRVELDKLVGTGRFKLVNCRGGAMLFKSTDFKDRTPSKRSSPALNKILA